jgi:hypothetical protein
MAEQGRSFGQRLIGSLKLDATVYEEVEHRPEALPQSVLVVALGGVAEGLAFIRLLGVGGIVSGIVSGFLGWLVATAIIWALGVRLLGHTSSFQELLRTLGFASAPRLLLVIGLVPLGPLYPLLRLGVTVLTVIAFVIAVRQALDVTTGRSVFVCVLAILATAVVAVLLGGPGALGG